MRIISNTFALMLLVSLTFAQKSTEEPPVVGPAKGSLVIVGGGKVPASIWARFIELAGGEGASIVFIPTASTDSLLEAKLPSEKDILEGLGVKVTVLHTRDRKEADTKAFVAALKTATGVWFGGGRQWRIADSYLNTLTHKELNKLLERGGVIGGTSAGATIQGSFLLRGDTKANTILIGDHVQGLDFIHNVAIDQHIFPRNRQFDLVEVIKKKPELLGIGIDESTAIVVQKDTFQVIGNSFVAIYDYKNFDPALKNPSGDSGNNGPFYFLSPKQKFDLRQRVVIKEANN